jgi:hypothetical protein
MPYYTIIIEKGDGSCSAYCLVWQPQPIPRKKPQS